MGFDEDVRRVERTAATVGDPISEERARSMRRRVEVPSRPERVDELDSAVFARVISRSSIPLIARIFSKPTLELLVELKKSNTDRFRAWRRKFLPLGIAAPAFDTAVSLAAALAEQKEKRCRSCGKAAR